MRGRGRVKRVKERKMVDRWGRYGERGEKLYNMRDQLSKRLRERERERGKFKEV